ncbi:MAG: hypothetical protein P4L43_13600 [Syntrophobacteraceae bacterium]|nr:hypothetical protein [Syntrophobacteraceae bacterium]
MHRIDDRKKPAAKQSTGLRVFWFFVGAGMNYALISTPFRFLRLHTGLPIIAISAASMTVSVAFFFFWNYFVNFRTDSRKKNALARYLAAVACMWALSTFTLTLLKSLDPHYGFLSISGFPLDLDILSTQACLAGFKFLLYHKWVFPAERQHAYEH